MSGERQRVMVVFGTRPEAIKMAPVVQALEKHALLRPLLVVTGQHRQMLDPVLDAFALAPDVDLGVMEPGQSLADLTARVIKGLAGVLAHQRPAMVLVHGDTTTTLAAALASFYARLPLGHVEAGLRTGNMQAPWPEEMNRRLVAPLCTLHFAPTKAARTNLLREGIPDGRIHVTGNTVIDALLQTDRRLRTDCDLAQLMHSRFGFLDPKRRLLLVTCHRRESFGEGMERICRALAMLAHREDLQIVYPVHLNPHVRDPVHRLLSGFENIHLIEPQDYMAFVHLLGRAELVLTDSGGVQEEAPSLSKPVLVMRDVTERPEAVAAGTALLVGTEPARIVAAVTRLLDTPDARRAMLATANPYGDGHASDRIVAALTALLQRPNH